MSKIRSVHTYAMHRTVYFGWICIPKLLLSLGDWKIFSLVFFSFFRYLEFEEFCQLSAKFLVEEDPEGMKKELKEAFRIYDKAGNGYIPISALKEILHELDPKLTDHELDGIIEEVDEDGSGTVDFDEFMEMMTG